MSKKLDDKDLEPVSGGASLDPKTEPKGGPRPSGPLQDQVKDEPQSGFDRQ